MEKNLSKEDIRNLSEMAKEKRRLLDIGMSPVGDNIFKFIKKNNIQLVYIPIENILDEKVLFSGVYVSLNEDGYKERFIGLNTNDYYDNQIFTLAHELYHFYEESQVHFCRIGSESQNTRELKANRFAAEFLLPTEILKLEIENENKGELDISNWTIHALIRFIATIHCEYKLPYKAIVKRLFEISAITIDQYNELDKKSTRNKNDEYYVVASAINFDIFKQLNEKTKKMGADGSTLENIIKNYEDDIVSITEIIDSLGIFNRSIDEFAIEDEIDDEDLEDINSMFGDE